MILSNSSSSSSKPVLIHVHQVYSRLCHHRGSRCKYKVCHICTSRQRDRQILDDLSSVLGVFLISADTVSTMNLTASRTISALKTKPDPEKTMSSTLNPTSDHCVAALLK